MWIWIFGGASLVWAVTVGGLAVALARQSARAAAWEQAYQTLHDQLAEETHLLGEWIALMTDTEDPDAEDDTGDDCDELDEADHALLASIIGTCD
jgi:hypothetical protein